MYQVIFRKSNRAQHSVEPSTRTEAWDANDPGDSVTNYIISWGAASGVYTSSVTVGTVTTYASTPMIHGRVYFVVQASNSVGISGYSREIYAPFG